MQFDLLTLIAIQYDECIFMLNYCLDRNKVFHFDIRKLLSNKVGIPVGCVPPASVATVNRMTDRQV